MTPPSIETLTKAADAVGKAGGFLGAVSSLLVPLFPGWADKVQQFRNAEALNQALGELLKGEIATRTKLREEMFTQYYDPNIDDLSRFRIERDLEDLDQKIRSTSVIAKALVYKVSDEKASETSGKRKVEQSGTVQPHWLDRFDALARAKNEPWREELLARAFAKETDSPGSVFPRTLWVIGNMEERAFNALEKLLELCLWIDNRDPFIPNTKVPALERSHPDLPVGSSSVAALTFQLGDLGILGNMSAMGTFAQGGRVSISYAAKRLDLHFLKLHQFGGIVFTDLGQQISTFAEKRAIATGYDIFDDYTELLDGTVIALPKPGA